MYLFSHNILSIFGREIQWRNDVCYGKISLKEINFYTNFSITILQHYAECNPH